MRARRRIKIGVGGKLQLQLQLGKLLIYIGKRGSCFKPKYPLCGLLCSGQSCHFVRIRWVGGRWGSEGEGSGAKWGRGAQIRHCLISIRHCELIVLQ